jgi:hypothetical protein
MKRFIVAAVVVGVLATALTATAFAASPAQGFGPGMGMHTPGTGLTQPGTGFGPRGGAPAWAGQPDEVQKLLGMGETDIQALRLKGQSLAEIAAGKNITRDALVSAILKGKKDALDKLVVDGKLDEAQAKYMGTRMESQVSNMVDRKTTGPAWRTGTNAGARPGMGMGMGGRWNR